MLAEAQAHLQAAQALERPAPPRERAHLEAVQRVLDGRWHAACDLGRAAGGAPARRAGAAVGPPVGLLPRRRHRPAPAARRVRCPSGTRPTRCTPTCWPCTPSGWRSATSTRRPKRPAAARWPPSPRALGRACRGPCDGDAGPLRRRRRLAAPAPAGSWADGNGFAGHLWWHKALFRLEALDFEGVLRLLDSHLSGDALQITLQRVDAAAMLWRLHLLGEDVGRAPAPCWPAGHRTTRRRLLRLQRRARGCWRCWRRRRGALPSPGWRAAPAGLAPERRGAQQPC
jgi:hypothetical protein